MKNCYEKVLSQWLQGQPLGQERLNKAAKKIVLGRKLPESSRCQDANRSATDMFRLSSKDGRKRTSDCGDITAFAYVLTSPSPKDLAFRLSLSLSGSHLSLQSFALTQNLKRQSCSAHSQPSKYVVQNFLFLAFGIGLTFRRCTEPRGAKNRFFLDIFARSAHTAGFWFRHGKL